MASRVGASGGLVPVGCVSIVPETSGGVCRILPLPGSIAGRAA